MIGYKAFDKNLQCRGFQYEVGKEYEIDGKIKVCKRGFHACENPLEVFDHYDMLNSRFCKVEQTGDIDKEKNSTKICSSKIKIVAELKLSDMIRLGVEWLKEVTSPSNIKVTKTDSGEYAQIGSSGDCAQIGSSGDCAQIGSSGEYAKIGSSGNCAKIGSSGEYAKIGSSGDCAKIESTGENSVICCAGYNSIAKAKKGSWITLSEWKYDRSLNRDIPIFVKTEYVDGERIKPDIWYRLVNGEFTEVE